MERGGKYILFSQMKDARLFLLSFQGIRWHYYDRLRVEYIIISGNGEIERASLDSDLLCMALVCWVNGQGGVLNKIC